MPAKRKPGENVDPTLVLQQIAATLCQLVAQLESRPPDAGRMSADRDTLLEALQRAVELEQSGHDETHQLLELIRDAIERQQQYTVGAAKLREDFDKRFSQLAEYVELRANQLQESIAKQGSHGVGLYWDLKPRLEMLEQQLFSRRFSDELRAKFERHYPEHRWEDAIARFDRWIMTEKICHSQPSGAFRKFIRVWLGEARPRWLGSAAGDDGEDTGQPEAGA